LIDGFGGPPLESAVVLIDGDRIVAVGQVGRLAVPDSAEVLDANGMTVMPGLWESHGHLQNFGAGRPPAAFQSKFPDRVMEVMTTVAEVSLLAGVTSFRDLGGPLEQQKQLREDIEAGKKEGPRLFLAGPGLKQRKKGTEAEGDKYAVANPDGARRAVEELARMNVDQIWADGRWELEILESLVDAAHRAGLGVDLGVRQVEAYRTGVQAGADCLHSVFTADPLSDYSEDELRLLIRGEKPVALGPSANILRGPYIAPSMEMRQAYVRALQFPESLDHPRFRKQFAPDIYQYLRETWRFPQSIPWGIGAPKRMEIVQRKVRRFIEAGGREQIVAGTDAGSPLNFHVAVTRELMNLVDAGLPARGGGQAGRHHRRRRPSPGRYRRPPISGGVRRQERGGLQMSPK
jgi:hypothetical protein